MQCGVGAEILADPAVEGRERVRRRKALLEQQTHRVALVAHAGLDADEHVAESLTQDEEALAVAEQLAGRRTPLRLDLAQVAFAPHVVIHRHRRVHVGRRAVLRGVAADEALAQRVHTGRQIHRVALVLHRSQGVEERLEHRQVGGGAGVAGVGREVEDHRRHLALRALRTAQGDQLAHAGGQRVGALAAGLHVVHAVGAVEGAALAAALATHALGRATTAVDHRSGGAVQLGDRHHHGRLDRQQAALGGAPVVQRLELHRRDRQVGHVQPRQDVFGGVGVVVGRATDEREAGQRDQCVDGGLSVPEEVRLDGRSVVQAGREGGNHAQATRLQRGNDAVVVAGVAGQQVGAHHQQAHGAVLAAGGHARQVVRRGRQALRHARVVDADFGVVQRCGRLEAAAQALAWAVGVAVDQELHQVEHVLFGPGQPVLHGQEIGAHVLRRAGNETQDLGQAAQHAHLARTGGGLLLGRGAGVGAALAAQLLQKRHRPGAGRAHVELAHARQARDLGRRHQADHGVAGGAPRLQRGQHRQEVVFHEQHAHQHDVAAGDVVGAALQRGRIVAPLGRRVHRQRQARHRLGEAAVRAPGGAGQVAVHRHQHDPHAGRQRPRLSG